MKKTIFLLGLVFMASIHTNAQQVNPSGVTAANYDEWRKTVMDIPLLSGAVWNFESGEDGTLPVLNPIPAAQTVELISNRTPSSTKQSYFWGRINLPGTIDANATGIVFRLKITCNHVIGTNFGLRRFQMAAIYDASGRSNYIVNSAATEINAINNTPIYDSDGALIYIPFSSLDGTKGTVSGKTIADVKQLGFYWQYQSGLPATFTEDVKVEIMDLKVVGAGVGATDDAVIHINDANDLGRTLFLNVPVLTVANPAEWTQKIMDQDAVGNPIYGKFDAINEDPATGSIEFVTSKTDVSRNVWFQKRLTLPQPVTAADNAKGILLRLKLTHNYLNETGDGDNGDYGIRRFRIMVVDNGTQRQWPDIDKASEEPLYEAKGCDPNGAIVYLPFSSLTLTFPISRIDFYWQYQNVGTVDLEPIKVKISDLKIVGAESYVIEAGESRSWSNYVSGGYGDIIIHSNDEGLEGSEQTGQLTGISSDVTVNGTVKLKKTFAKDKWYAVGFPFAIDHVSCDVDIDDETYNKNALQTHNADHSGGDYGDYWLKTYNSAADTFNDYTAGATSIAAGGYALQIPDALDGATFIFTSGNGVILSNSSNFTTELGNYKLTYNPSVANIEIGNTASDYYYAFEFNHAGNFGLLTDDDSYDVKPFESVIVANNITGALRSSLNIETITKINEIPANDAIKEVRHYNLQGVEIHATAHGAGVVIVKTVYQSGAVSLSKIIRK